LFVWVVIEVLYEGPWARPRTLFATHYHELTDLEETFPALRNRNARVAETDGRIIFLHSIAPGRADRSYGIHVAQLAGVPAEVLGRASEILSQLEREHGTSGGNGMERGRGRKRGMAGVDHDERAALLGELAKTPIESLTPIEALQRLADLRERARKEGAR